jgi:hypothetical protein
LEFTVERLEGLQRGKARHSRAHGEVFLQLRGRLLGQQAVEEVGIGMCLFARLLEEGLKAFMDFEPLKLLQTLVDATHVGMFHSTLLARGAAR